MLEKRRRIMEEKEILNAEELAQRLKVPRAISTTCQSGDEFRR